MNLAFVTMVWRDYWLLGKWVQHNAAIVPKRHLYVLNHGGDPEIDRIADGCNVIHVPRDGVTLDLTRRRWDLVAGVTNGLLAFHDAVVCTDVDELLVYAGDKPSLLDHLAARPVEKDALAPIGLNLMPMDGKGTDPDEPVLAQHPNALLSAKYTKPCVAARSVAYTVGGHGLVGGRFTVDPEILLLHLHFVTPDYAERMRDRQEIVAESKRANVESGGEIKTRKRFWINWSDPDMVFRKNAQRLQLAEPWDEAA
ncbi:MAG: hypothetical protein AAGB28_15940, partial [Pseudomonadota bacterium]